MTSIRSSTCASASRRRSTHERELAGRFERDGFVFPLDVLSRREAARYCGYLEAHESRIGGPLDGDYLLKAYLLFTWAADLIRHPRLLDAVEQVLGPNILVWDADILIKEAHHSRYIGWHQDSTYWGLEPPDVLTAWVGLTPANPTNGAMRFIPGSHRGSQFAHVESMDVRNATGRRQEVPGVDETRAVRSSLEAGQASLHHIRLLHASGPNQSANRRIGLAIRYMAAHVRQVGDGSRRPWCAARTPTGISTPEPRPRADFDAAACAAHRGAVERALRNYYRDVDREVYEK